MEDYLKRIKQREIELAQLRKRQDADEALRHLSKYKMVDTNDKEVADIINVTLNRPAVFFNNVVAALGKVTEQIVVECERKSLDTDYIEDFIRSYFAMANSTRRKGKPELNALIDEQTCIRGGVAVRVATFVDEDGNLHPGLACWDWRYTTWEDGRDGLAYAAHSTRQKASDIQSQAWYKEIKDTRLVEKVINRSATKSLIRDVWDFKHNEILIDEDKVFEQGHDYGFTPVALQIVSLGSNLEDEDNEQYHGESVFFLIRTVMPELNRLASIMQTLNLRAVKAPMKAKRKGATSADEVPSHEEIAGMSAVTVMEPDEDIQAIDYGDAKRSAELAFNMFNQALSEGSLPPEAYGSIDLDLSGVALVELGERSGGVLVPRLDTKALVNKEIAEMFTRQCIQIGGSLEIGTHGHKRSFDMEKIKGEYDVKVKYFAKSPKLDLARYSMAAQAKTVGIPQRTIDEEVLQFPDPDGIERQRRWEQAEQLSPIIRLQRIIKSRLEDAERGDEEGEFEAEVLSTQMRVMIEQMMTGNTEQPGIEETPKPTPGLGASMKALPSPTTEGL